MIIRPIKPELDLIYLQHMAEKHLVPLYGDQSKAIESWKAGQKAVYVSTEDDGKVGGFVALKSSDNKPYIKMSTLLVGPSFRGRGIGKSLLEMAICHVTQSDRDQLLVTVSEGVTSTLNLLAGYNFQKVAELNDKYIEGQKELVLIRGCSHE